MRILNVTPSYFPFEEFGGPPVKVRALSKEMLKRKHEVTVLTVDWGVKEEDRRADSRSLVLPVERSAFGWNTIDGGIEVIYLKRRLGYRGLTWNPGVKQFCRARLSNFEVAHIFGLYDLLGPGVAMACRRIGVPYLVEPMGMAVPIVRNLWLKRMYHRLLGREMMGSAAAIVATSEQEATELISVGVPKGKIYLRRNGVQSPEVMPEWGRFRQRFGIEKEVKLILYLGRLSEKKSPDLLVRAFAKLRSTNPGAEMRLVIAGPEERGMEARLVNLAAELGVSEHVNLCGPLYGDAKWSAYRDADVFVLPSQNENFGNTAGEAVLAGTPVILTEQCGIAPLLGTAALVTRHDLEELTEALGRVLFERSVQAWLKAGCREAAEKLDWQEPGRQMENLYQSLARNEAQFMEAAS